MIPNFVLIIGAMKCGTTTLYNYLRQHPQIAIARTKEPRFFAFEETWALGTAWYESLFNYNPKQHLYALDASTDYTKYPFCTNVTERLKASAPRRFKLIYIMRHPLHRIESHARHVQRTRHEVGRCISPRETHSLDAGVSPVSFAISRYAYQIDFYQEYYDRGELLLLTLEGLARDPKHVLKKVCEFLEIAPLVPAKISLKSNVADPYLRNSPVRKGLSALWRTSYQNPLLRNIGQVVIPKVVRARVYQVAELSAREGRFHLSADEADALIAALLPDLARLRERYGIDVEKEWGIELSMAKTREVCADQ